MKLSSLAPSQFPKMPIIKGIRFNAVACGLKKSGNLDLMIVVMEEGTSVATVVTDSYTEAAPIKWIKNIRNNEEARAILVNSGNANAFTGKVGFNNVILIAKNIAKILGCKHELVYLASTGVIGEQLELDKILNVLPSLYDNTSTDPLKWRELADSILTTDTFPKGMTKEITIEGNKIKLLGIAKGSGMIAPNMATMLAFIFTDMSIRSSLLKQIISEVCEVSFNSISVDGDKSTSDAVCIFATNKVMTNNNINSLSDPRLIKFKHALRDLCIDLAKQIVCDGEGAKKLIEISISGTERHKDAKIIALSIANSPLVKTAIAGEDANWGRIIMAIGATDIAINQDEIELSIGNIEITKYGSLVKNYNEDPVSKHLRGKYINIDVKVGLGRGFAKVWTCDLNKEYIDINTGYRS